MRRVDSLAAILAIAVAIAISPAPLLAQTAGPAAWQNDLTPIGAKDWNRDFAAHLLAIATHQASSGHGQHQDSRLYLTLRIFHSGALRQRACVLFLERKLTNHLRATGQRL